MTPATAPELAGNQLIVPSTGEVFDLEQLTLEDAARLAELALEWHRAVAAVKDRAQEVLRAELARQGRDRLAVGDLEVTEQAGNVKWLADQLHADLLAAGMAPERLAELFEYRVRREGASELAKLERRNADYAELIAAARTRQRGRIVVTRRGVRVAPPERSAAIEAEAARRAELERDARERGI